MGIMHADRGLALWSSSLFINKAPGLNWSHTSSTAAPLPLHAASYVSQSKVRRGDPLHAFGPPSWYAVNVRPASR